MDIAINKRKPTAVPQQSWVQVPIAADEPRSMQVAQDLCKTLQNVKVSLGQPFRTPEIDGYEEHATMAERRRQKFDLYDHVAIAALHSCIRGATVGVLGGVQGGRNL